MKRHGKIYSPEEIAILGLDGFIFDIVSTMSCIISNILDNLLLFLVFVILIPRVHMGLAAFEYLGYNGNEPRAGCIDNDEDKKGGRDNETREFVPPQPDFVNWSVRRHK
jgi:hypothetical protein